MVNIMLQISHTKIKSTSKKKKGQWYPRMYIKSSNWDKEIKPRHREVLFYYRADTEEKKKQNRASQKLLDSIYIEYKERFAGSEYQDGVKQSISLKKQLDEMVDLKADKSKSTIQGYNNLKKGVRGVL